MSSTPDATFALAVALWATLQLTWTSILLAGQLIQIARQMTTFEVSNLSKFGFMGGGGDSLAMQQGHQHTGAGSGVSGEEVDPSSFCLGPWLCCQPLHRPSSTIDAGSHTPTLAYWRDGERRPWCLRLSPRKVCRTIIALLCSKTESNAPYSLLLLTCALRLIPRMSSRETMRSNKQSTPPEPTVSEFSLLLPPSISA